MGLVPTDGVCTPAYKYRVKALMRSVTESSLRPPARELCFCSAARRLVLAALALASSLLFLSAPEQIGFS
jgi:hypothetical protein